MGDVPHKVSRPFLFLSITMHQIWRGVRTRTMGCLKVNNINLYHHLSQLSCLVLFMPTEFNPDNDFLKWNNPLLEDRSGENVFSNTLLFKYMDQHYDLKGVLYLGKATNYIMWNKLCRKPVAGKLGNSDDEGYDHNQPVSCANNKGRFCKKLKKPVEVLHAQWKTARVVLLGKVHPERAIRLRYLVVFIKKLIWHLHGGMHPSHTIMDDYALTCLHDAHKRVVSKSRWYLWSVHDNIQQWGFHHIRDSIYLIKNMIWPC